MPIKPILEEDVLIKGSADGITILLNLNQDYEKLVKKLIQKVKKEKKFLSGSKLLVKGIDRNLDIDELGMARKMIKDKTGLTLESPDYLQEKIETPVINKLKQTEMINHTLRAGDKIMTQSDVVILGDINPGAEISSKGSIYIYGKIRGSVHAGLDGNQNSIITCLGFSPIHLQIADITLNDYLDSTELHSSICFLYVDSEEIKILSQKKE